MTIEAGRCRSEPNVPSPETDRLSPPEIQHLIYKSHLDSPNGPKPAIKKFSTTFFENYIKIPENFETIEKLKKNRGELNNDNIRLYFINGLITNLAVSQRITELSDYQPEEIALSFARYFSLVVESLSQIPIEKTSPKSAIRLIIEHPNYLEPDFYKLFINQIKYDTYYNKANILRALSRSPKRAKEMLENNNTIFESIKTALTTNDSTRIIKYPKIRQLVENKGEKAIGIVSEQLNDFYHKPKQREKSQKYKKINQLAPASQPTIDKSSKARIPNYRTNLDPQQPTEQTQEENDSGINRSRNHPNLPLVAQIDSSLFKKYQDLHHPLLTDFVIKKILNKYSQPDIEIEKAKLTYDSLVEQFKDEIKENNTILLAITEACLSNEDNSVSFVSRYIARFDYFKKKEKYSNIFRSIIASTIIRLMKKEITLEEVISKLDHESTQWQ